MSKTAVLNRQIHRRSWRCDVDPRGGRRCTDPGGQRKSRRSAAKGRWNLLWRETVHPRGLRGFQKKRHQNSMNMYSIYIYIYYIWTPSQLVKHLSFHQQYQYQPYFPVKGSHNFFKVPGADETYWPEWKREQVWDLVKGLMIYWAVIEPLAWLWVESVWPVLVENIA